jgi:hypothetical protein
MAGEMLERGLGAQHADLPWRETRTNTIIMWAAGVKSQ